MNRKLFVLPASILLALASFSANAWDGTDSSTGESVEIERGTLVRSGRSIDYYNYDAGEYKTATVESVRRYGSTVEVEVTDEKTGDTTTLEMEGQ